MGASSLSQPPTKVGIEVTVSKQQPVVRPTNIQGKGQTKLRRSGSVLNFESFVVQNDVDDNDDVTYVWGKTELSF